MMCLHFIQSESKNALYITPSSFSINNVVWTDGLVISFFRKKLTTLSYFDTNGGCITFFSETAPFIEIISR